MESRGVNGTCFSDSEADGRALLVGVRPTIYTSQKSGSNASA